MHLLESQTQVRDANTQIAKLTSSIIKIDSYLRSLNIDPNIPLPPSQKTKGKKPLKIAGPQKKLGTKVTTTKEVSTKNPVSKPEIQMVKNPNMSEYGGWADSIRRMQEKHPTVGGRPITWYQATPDGSCFFIAVEAVLNRRTNVHNRRLASANQLR